MNTKLKRYTKTQKITLTKLAQNLKYSRQHISEIANGQPAGKKLALKIEKWSNGHISHTELLYPKGDIVGIPENQNETMATSD